MSRKLAKEEKLKVSKPIKVEFYNKENPKFSFKNYKNRPDVIKKSHATEEWYGEKARELLRVVSLPRFKYLLRDTKDFIRSLVEEILG